MEAIIGRVIDTDEVDAIRLLVRVSRRGVLFVVLAIMGAGIDGSGGLDDDEMGEVGGADPGFQRMGPEPFGVEVDLRFGMSIGMSVFGLDLAGVLTAREERGENAESL